ncbi:pyridoxamine 5'-phosphate oxidase family protein [Salipiger mangrovisoli]|uniref:Pyridoxamine 5'-phosphate oxidase family protein n=1 Tax=Salipiger mangrovisoli TaxID=2865933 RepID=A0ABR9X641_9RHOB|nr:pyridoxamine 5'-phosphate oxidase family protein [Salipiger mangrovisoli]MBE9639069.1 pyridoxamine 5'-phosphate oxidase family protein [Salipiger mangrovisoli]
MRKIDSIEALEALYGTAAGASIDKVVRRMTPLYRKWIEGSKLCVLSTVGPAGTDASPRGDDGPVVLEIDPGTLAMPDWRGNNRLDSLRNVVEDGRVSLMFFVPGSNNVVRVNGTGWLTDDAEMRGRFAKDGKRPATVLIIEIAEIYTQCARALVRAGTWRAGDESAGLPTIGQFLAEATQGATDGEAYDREWPERAAKSLW